MPITPTLTLNQDHEVACAYRALSVEIRRVSIFVLHFTRAFLILTCIHYTYTVCLTRNNERDTN